MNEDSVISISGDIWPRDNPEYRYRVYVKGVDGKPTCVTASATPEGMGLALVTVMREHIEAGYAPSIVGILDATEGKWLTSMWSQSPFGSVLA